MRSGIWWERSLKNKRLGSVSFEGENRAVSERKFEYQMPGLCIEPERLSICMEAGQAYEGSIRISNSEGRRMKGIIYADNLLFTLSKEQFVGEELTIPFVFHANGAKAGENYEGNSFL